MEKVLEAEVKGKSWEQDMKGFEQHMQEESEVRLDWKDGKPEDGSLRCTICGDKNAWVRVHSCCQDECKKHLSAFQEFSLAVWDDISAAPLGPEMVKAARRLEIASA